MNKTAIALFVYNRPFHTLKVLESLKKSKIDSLYIFCDGPKDINDVDKVQETRFLIKSIDWTKTFIFENNENRGLAKSLVSGINRAFKDHERVIVIEDDCIAREDFFVFMEKCFDKYQNTNVMSVSGYSLPITLPEDYKYDIYFCQRSSCWGWGTWKEKWKYYKDDISILDEIKKNSDLKEKINLCGEDLILMLELQKKNLLNSWAVFWSISIALNDGICINPVAPLVKNIGFDGSGEHCKSFRINMPDLSDKKIDFTKFPEETKINEKIMIECSKLYKLNLLGKLKKIAIKIKYIRPFYLAIRKILRKISRIKKRRLTNSQECGRMKKRSGK
ncbi:MAG TPA: hypothetical protein PLG34_06105 [Spirochaetota bacterium]|jgi:hypothetical protein|nr:MAG: hypothetical protein BWX91_01329 [Spirochaetes bacterium ADurb.Bin133]HNZ28106.1 hypothetical protein [Spirochaetota bacterium]HPY87535.1 hypothetical protein [Spirochaetota bacterium]HQB61487.1 hypothetical protein [Spirochaetota bacterium]